MYLVKSPWWLKRYYSQLTWQVDTPKKELYLTFDDGPHPIATPFVLNTLKEYEAKATFFCIGKNVEAERLLYQRIAVEGHAVGNHTQHHLNGWKTNDEVYLQDVLNASFNITSKLFRPPYGRIKKSQAQQLLPSFNIIMWDVLSADFDTSISAEKCLQNVLSYARPGSIVVFHDSEKAFQRLEYALPRVLAYYKKSGYIFSSLM